MMPTPPSWRSGEGLLRVAGRTPWLLTMMRPCASCRCRSSSFRKSGEYLHGNVKWKPKVLLGRTSQNAVKAKFAEFTYHEDKPCMLARLKSAADFSRGCAHQQCNRPFLRPAPPPTQENRSPGSETPA